jgi:hypothetical protein
MTFVPVIKTVTIDGTVTADVTGEGDVPVTLDSEVVAVDATGQGDVPVTLDSEVVDVDATGQGDVPITLDGEDVGLDAGENHIGQVGMEDNVITITPTLDTSAYADGDVLFETEAIANAVRNNGESCILQSIHVLDKGDQGEDFELVFLDEDQDLGTANAAVSISEANSTKIIGHYAFSNDYVDLINTQIRCDTGIGLVLKAGAATTSLYVGGISKGTGTYADGDIVIKLGFLRN